MRRAGLRGWGEAGIYYEWAWRGVWCCEFGDQRVEMVAPGWSRVEWSSSVCVYLLVHDRIVGVDISKEDPSYRK